MIFWRRATRSGSSRATGKRLLKECGATSTATFSRTACLVYFAIQQSTRNYDVFHCIDWFLYPSRTAKINAITYFDLTPMLFPEFHEDLNIAKEKSKLKVLPKYDFIFCISHYLPETIC